MRRLTLLFLLFSTPALAGSLASDEAKIEELSELHAQADQFLAEDKCFEALVIYQNILLIEADDEVAYTNSGYCHMLTGNFTKAKESFENALHINPENEVAQMGLRKIKDPDGEWKLPNG
jgi:tetratricopeptide (TPR) repeat protein